MNLRGGRRREFPQSVRKAAFRRCCQQAPEGVENVPGVPQCENCGNIIRAGGLIYEHFDPDGLGGEPTADNCKCFCSVCADTKTTEEDNPRMRKADAVLKTTFDLKPARRQEIRSRGFPQTVRRRPASTPVVKWKGYE